MSPVRPKDMKKFLILGCTFVLGIGVGNYWQAAWRDRLEFHWRAVEEFKQYFVDSDGWADSGQPPYPQVSLAKLVQAGVLRHIDIVFPNVPYEQKHLGVYWMERCVANTNIVFAFGNPSTPQFGARGVQPLHLNLWFRDAAAEDVRCLIDDIDAVWSGSGADQGHASKARCQ